MPGARPARSRAVSVAGPAAKAPISGALGSCARGRDAIGFSLSAPALSWLFTAQGKPESVNPRVFLVRQFSPCANPLSTRGVK